MFETFFPNEATGIAVLALGCATTLMVFGGFGVLTLRDPAQSRMRALRRSGVNPAAKNAAVYLLKANDTRPKGLLRSLIPQEKSERVQIQLQLAQAGFDGPDALRNFFLMRMCLAMFVPFFLLALMSLGKVIALPQSVDTFLVGLSTLRLLQIMAVSVAVGFYGPGWWLKSRITARQRRVEDGFPNALDLLQISVEAGLGFDAALARVGAELGRVSPEIAFEFLMVQQEILAGRDREQAMADMANRMGIREAQSFVGVVAQSLQYGTSLTEALNSYAVEMRENRELRAQEKANKLPVQMSAVMALLMLPALFMITLTPIVIRYMGIYGGQ